MLVVVLISQVGWRPLLGDKLGQPVAGGEQSQTEDQQTGDCEVHGFLSVLWGGVRGPGVVSAV